MADTGKPKAGSQHAEQKALLFIQSENLAERANVSEQVSFLVGSSDRRHTSTSGQHSILIGPGVLLVTTATSQSVTKQEPSTAEDP